MKKLFAILLAVAMIAALSVTAFAAADNNALNGEADSIDVKGTYNAGQTTHNYLVSLTWDDMAYTYYAADVKTWDTTTMKWTISQEAGWVLTSGSEDIVVSNKSSEGITATFTWAAATGFEDVDGSFTDAEGTALTGGALPVAAATAGDEETNGTAGTATAKFVIGGELTVAEANAATLGTITVAIS